MSFHVYHCTAQRISNALVQATLGVWFRQFLITNPLNVLPPPPPSSPYPRRPGKCRSHGTLPELTLPISLHLSAPLLTETTPMKYQVADHLATVEDAQPACRLRFSVCQGVCINHSDPFYHLPALFGTNRHIRAIWALFDLSECSQREPNPPCRHCASCLLRHFTQPCCLAWWLAPEVLCC